MASGTPTTNLGLRTMTDADSVDAQDINYNSGVLDTKIGAVGSTSLQSQVTALNDNIGGSKIINSKYYNSATTVATIQTDIETAIVPYVESGKPKFMEFGYMSGTAGRSIGLKDGCFINVWFNGTALILVEFVSMTLNEVNYMRKVSNWSGIEQSLNDNIATKAVIKTTTISMDTESNSLRLDNKGIAFGKFICAFVRGTNNITCLPYSYSNAYYVKFVNTDTLQVVSGQYDVYILYWET